MMAADLADQADDADRSRPIAIESARSAKSAQSAFNFGSWCRLVSTLSGWLRFLDYALALRALRSEW